MNAYQAPPDYIPLAMLNALAYCPRRFGYEFIYAEMLYNEHVIEGQLRHQGIDIHGMRWLSDSVQQRRVYVWSERLRIAGFCDIVEERDGQLYPVEYKKGRSGQWDNDRIQLCGQALCLEERTGQPIERGYIFYFSARRREEVTFTAELRRLTEETAAEAHRLATRGDLPPPTTQRARCRDCSLQPLCLPVETERLKTIRSDGW
ncbi:CRISPR-associated protein Cas4 [Chloroflexus sp.]|uniref:CRISPR-associated protein Cas4 n=1 Tax=Chloroflexus sp. TaxID=1904827 RepID=UPI002ACE6F3B|nr:CRISPR-associated protein Cas4 [Chloroflexus sp.]